MSIEDPSPATDREKDFSVPGFVDLQINGYGGIDFSSPLLTSGDAEKACEHIVGGGTAAFLATVVTCSETTYRRNLPLLGALQARADLRPHLLGLHVEGPFISAQSGAVGAHNAAWVRAPDCALLQRMQEWANGSIRMLTLAPELPGAMELIAAATAMDIVVSLGHTLAGEADIDQAANAGARAFTHLGNGLPNLIHRHQNPIWPTLAQECLAVTLVADGFHLPPSFIKSAVRTMGMERAIVVSDGSPLAGLPPGSYDAFGGPAVLEPSGLLHDPERQCLVGSSRSMLECMNHVASLEFLSPTEMLRLGFDNPLRLLGLPRERISGPNRITYDAASRRFVSKGGTHGPGSILQRPTLRRE